MVSHPNRRILDCRGSKFFLDFDEIVVLFPLQITFVAPENPMTLQNGFAVEGYTKTGLKLSSLLGGNYLFEDRKSGKVDECVNFINTYWVTK